MGLPNNTYTNAQIFNKENRGDSNILKRTAHLKMTAEIFSYSLYFCKLDQSFCSFFPLQATYNMKSCAIVVHPRVWPNGVG